MALYGNIIARDHAHGLLNTAYRANLTAVAGEFAQPTPDPFVMVRTDPTPYFLAQGSACEITPAFASSVVHTAPGRVTIAWRFWIVVSDIVAQPELEALASRMELHKAALMTTFAYGNPNPAIQYQLVGVGSPPVRQRDTAFRQTVGVQVEYTIIEDI